MVVSSVLKHPIGLLLLVAGSAAGQGVLNTAAGTDWYYSSVQAPAQQVPMGYVYGLGSDPKGNIYVTDMGNRTVWRLDRSGTMTRILGDGMFGQYAGDNGPALNAATECPSGVTADAAGNVYVTDICIDSIRRVSPDGIVTRIAGTLNTGFSGDGGPAVRADINTATGITVDAAGNIYFIDSDNKRIRRISTAGIVTTIAGTGTEGYSGDGGAATSAQLSFGPPYHHGIVVDPSGNILFTDSGNHRVRIISPSGVIATFAGNGNYGSAGDGGLATSASLKYPAALAIDTQGSVYVADGEAGNVRKITKDGIIHAFAGNGQAGNRGDGGSALAAAIGVVAGLAADSEGNIYLVNYNDGIVRAVTPGGTISAVAGNGRLAFGGDGGPAFYANLCQPSGVALDRAGNLYIADQCNHRVRKVGTDGTIHTFAGTGEPAYDGDGGPAIQAALYYPQALAFDSAGNLFIADWGNCRIRKVAPSGVIATVAGNGSCTDSGDGGPAAAAGMGTPSAVMVDGAGNLFITLDGSNRIRKVDTRGIISTVAGTGTAGFSGDGGPAAQAQISEPNGIAADADGNLYFTDTGNNRVREISTAGIVTTIAGNGAAGPSGDGSPATAASITAPYGIVLDGSGNIYVSGYLDQTVRLISKGTITTIAGMPHNGGCCLDGAPAIWAIFSYPAGLALDSTGSLYIADLGNDRVRQILSHPVTMRVDQASLGFSGQSGGAPPPSQKVRVDGSVDGLRFVVTVDYGSGPSGWLAVGPTPGDSPLAVPLLLDVLANPGSLAAGQYTATVIVTPTDGLAPAMPVAVSFAVAPGVPPRLAVNTNFLTFTLPKGAAKLAEPLTVSNSGGGTLAFSAGAIAVTGGPWLSVTPSSGSALPGSPAVLSVQADPGALPSGTYTGQIAVTSGGSAQIVQVVMTISARTQAILLSQTGLSFLAVANGSTNIPPQSFGVVNLGSGAMPFTVSASTLQGGNWLSASFSSGTSIAGQPAPLVNITVNPTGLAQGVYYGTVQVDSPGAANTPQVVTVYLQVLAANANPGAIVQPPQLIFQTSADGASPSGQFLSIYNLRNTPAFATSGVFTLDSETGVLYRRFPRDFTILPDEPYRMLVQPAAPTLIPGTYRGEITVSVSDGSLTVVPLTLVITPAAGSSMQGASRRGGSEAAHAADTSCTPSALLPSLVNLGQSSTVSPGLPSGIWVNVTDDCGNSIDTGSVVARFSNGDPPVLLKALGSGRWQNTWSTGSGTASQVTVTVTAAQGNLQGLLQIPAGVTGPQQPPSAPAAGIVSASSPVSYVPAAPGAMLSIYGSDLATSPLQALSVPLPPSLGDTTVIVAGQTVPLYYAGPSQINAMLPFGLEINTTHQVLIRRGVTQSLPVPLNVAASQPGIFTTAGVQAIAVVVRGSASFLNGPGAAARAGDVLVMYASGLGAVTPAVAAGLPAPGNPLSSIDPTAIQLQVGSVTVPVQFAGLSPGFAGLYQLNFALPAGIPSGSAVPVTITVAGQTSPQASLVIE